MSSARSEWTGVAVGGLLAGVFDLIYAFAGAALRGRSPVRVLHSIASGLLGSAAYDSGAAGAALGVAAHFVIALGAAAVYLLAGRRLPVLRRRAVACGLAFGVGVYLVMNSVVLPLSAVPFKISYTASVLAQGFVSHGLLVGLPIALAVRRFARSEAHPVEHTFTR